MEEASYVYDAWGNIKSTNGNATLKELNPFRYRGYVYDEETSLYYLQSRYYDPFTGRFVNADDTAYIGATGTPLSTNIFTYCENNPVNGNDYSGNWFHKLKKYKRNVLDPLKYQAEMYLVMGYKAQYERYIKKYNKCKAFYDGGKYRYDYNKKKSLNCNGYIYGQDSAKCKKMKYGMYGTVGKNGCVAVALYNGMIKIGRKMKLCNIIMELDLNKMMNNYPDEYRSAGSIYAKEKFLKVHNIKYKKYSSYNKYFKNAKKYRVAIISIPGYVFCVIKNSEKLYVLNLFNSQNKLFKFNDYAEYIKTNFSTAYCLK